MVVCTQPLPPLAPPPPPAHTHLLHPPLLPGKTFSGISQTQNLPVPLILPPVDVPYCVMPVGRVFTSRSSGSARVSSKITGLELRADSRMDDINRFDSCEVECTLSLVEDP